MDYYHYHMYCPYNTGNDANKVWCDGNCRIQFPSIAACREYLQHYCADPEGYKSCTIAQMQEKCTEKKIAIQKEVRKWKREQAKNRPRK